MMDEVVVRDGGPSAAAAVPNLAVAPSETEFLVRLKDISRTYADGSRRVEVLSNLELTVSAGTFLVIRGESGSGKTTLLRVLGLMDRKFEGSYVFLGEDVTGKPEWWLDELRSHNIGFVFQEGQLFDHLSIRDNLLLPLRLSGTGISNSTSDALVEERSAEFFSAEELKDNVLGRRPMEVSGGQRQRAAIVRAISRLSPLILADEPTASLNEEYKQEIVDYLVGLCREGHTVIVVSHDSIFRTVGRQLELRGGKLHKLPDGKAWVDGRHNAMPGQTQFSAEETWAGWWPRASLGTLSSQIVREAFSRKLFLFLVVAALFAGVCQIAVFASVMFGTEEFVDYAIKRGSRLNRIEIKPLQVNQDKADHFPDRDTISANPGVESVIGRREATVRVTTRDMDSDGKPSTTTTPYTAMGLHSNDPEFKLLSFVSGGPFSNPPSGLEVIVSAALMNDVFDMNDLREGRASYSDYIGKVMKIRLPQFTPSGVSRGAVEVQLKLVGIIAFAEGGRQLYLPNTTLRAFDRFKADRSADPVKLPINPDGSEWSVPPEDVAAFADTFAWEDRLQIYTREIRDVVPVFGRIAEMGYRPNSDIWNFKWVLDIQDLVWNVFGPLLLLLVMVVGGTVWANIFTGAKLREREFALWRILGMRIGDLTLTQLLSTVLMVLVGTAVGLLAGVALIDWGRSYLHEQAAAAGTAAGRETQPLEMIFASIESFWLYIVVGAVVVGVAAAFYPAIRAARTDPAIILRS
jgi:ABC-type lipoprotein export system ATPase subunit/ABC-type lipoprotein release transport system permease subunit